MKKGLLALLLLSVFGLVQADNRPDHFKGLPSNTLEEAVKNFSEYNQKLSEVLARPVSQRDLVVVHQLTYTLENALEKIHEEVTQLVDTLEELHVASEGTDPQEMKRKGDVYLKAATTLIK